jgi:ubiquinone biosynthesis protein
MSATLATVLEVVLFIPALVVVSALAVRLLGVRRSWVAVSIASVLGWVSGIAIAAIVAGGDLESKTFVRNALFVAFLATMVIAVGVDLLARPGSLAKGEAAGQFVVPRPVSYVKLRIDTVRRTRELLGIARANGFGHLLGDRTRRGKRAAIDRAPAGVRARHVLEQAGGMFVKLGQIASTRTDVVPADVIAELSKLQDDVAVEPEAAMRDVVEAELGAPVEEVFAAFDWTPVAAASIGQVYFARLHDGEDVIVKVQRPGVAAAIDRDLKILLALAHRIEAGTPFGKEYGVGGLAQEFAGSLEEELDFTIEARNTEQIRKNMADVAGIEVPQVHLEFSTPRLMVQERFIGTPVRDVDQVRASGFDTRVLARHLMEAELTQVFSDGFFHADLHPGNLFVLPDGAVGMIDFGATGRLDPLLLASLRQMMVAVALTDASMLRESISEMTDIGADVDLDAFERALSRFMSLHVSGEIALNAKVVNDLFGLIGTFGVKIPPELTTFGRALLVLEGTLATMSPGFKLSAEARPWLEEWAKATMVPDNLDDALQQELIAQLPTLRALPRHADRIATQLQKGDLLTRVSLFSQEVDTGFISRMVNRIVLAFLGAALGFIGMILVSADPGTAEGQLVRVLGFVSLMGSAILMLRVVAAIVREGEN